jgi:uncharacterized protein
MQKLILGTVQLGLDYGINNATGKPSQAESLAILEKAQQAGISILDTAEGYGNAIDIIAAFHSNHKPFQIITKFVFKPGLNIETYVTDQLNKLKVDHIYALMFHKYSDMIAQPELLTELNKEKSKGHIRFVGVSIYTNEELQLCIRNPLIDLIQLPYNLLDNYTKRGELLRLAQKNNKVIHTRSAFLQGLFFKQTSTLNDKLKPLAPYLDSLHTIASDHDMTMEQLALNYVLHTPEIDNVMFGVENMSQLNHNLEAILPQFPEALYKQVSSIEVKETSLLNPVNWI